tara:strand:+ start:3058 stop:3672 length:615 start_codon:yes stop_codon:yes gene_type:complete
VTLTVINNEYPVWEVQGFHLPVLDIEWPEENLTASNLPVNKRRVPASLDENSDNHRNFARHWDSHTKDIWEHLCLDNTIKNEQPEILGAWPRGFKNFKWGGAMHSLHVIKDKNEFKMTGHMDNREVVGVLIINLQDNPPGTGTTFHTKPYSKNDENVWYEGPTEQFSGIFMINNWNTWHSVRNMSGKDRYIGYQTLNIASFFRG